MSAREPSAAYCVCSAGTPARLVHEKAYCNVCDREVRPRSAAKLCECGHPREAHLTLGSAQNWRKPCAATVYRRLVLDGPCDSSWPCPCKNFTEAAK